MAHKLDTVLDFDKVVVMNQGQLVEYGEPYKLLEREGSWFRSLYEDGASHAGLSSEGDIADVLQ